RNARDDASAAAEAAISAILSNIGLGSRALSHLLIGSPRTNNAHFHRPWRACEGFWTPAITRYSARSASRRPKTCTGHWLPASRLLLPHSALERSDFVPCSDSGGIAGLSSGPFEE